MTTKLEQGTIMRRNYDEGPMEGCPDERNETRAEKVERLNDQDGRYGWYVETQEPTTADGIVTGDYISVDSDGALYIWGKCLTALHKFAAGTWTFVYPMFEIVEPSQT